MRPVNIFPMHLKTFTLTLLVYIFISLGTAAIADDTFTCDPNPLNIKTGYVKDLKVTSSAKKVIDFTATVDKDDCVKVSTSGATGTFKKEINSKTNVDGKGLFKVQCLPQANNAPCTAKITLTADNHTDKTCDVDCSINNPQVPVPTLSEWGLIIFSLLLFMAIAFYLRSRRPRVSPSI